MQVSYGSRSEVCRSSKIVNPPFQQKFVRTRPPVPVVQVKYKNDLVCILYVYTAP